MNINLSDNLGKNLIINPSMDIAQRNTSFNVIASETYTLDRWKLNMGGAAYSLGVNQVADVPAWSQSTYSLKVTNQAAFVAPATSFMGVTQLVEGYNLRRLKSKKSIISFSVKASKVGVYTVLFMNASQDVRMTKAFTVNTANT